MSKMDIREIMMMLSSSERKVIKYFAERGIKNAYIDELAKAIKSDIAEVSRAALWLENKGLVKREPEEYQCIIPTEKGLKYKNRVLPEQAILDLLKKKNKVSLRDLFEHSGLEREEVNAAIGILIKQGFIEVKKEGNQKLVEITDLGKKVKELSSVQLMKNLLEKGKIITEDIKTWKELILRGLARKIVERRWKIALTPKGEELIKLGIPEVEVIEQITPEVIKSGIWKTKPIRWYDVYAFVPKVYGGRKHPLRVIMEKIRKVFLEMGFREMRGPWVELAFYNMDAMWIPQDHPARELQATFYIEKPEKGFVEDEELIKVVKEVQETGGDTGSTGWQQPWDPNEALRLLLRTHTTAVTFRIICNLIRKGKVKPPVKFFCIGRVFRNETIDWKHLAEFHQVEGVVLHENLTLRSLMGYISEFYRKMGIKKLRFKPTYNPYTEPSMEIFAWHPRLKKWIEVGNSGLFRPECLHPYGIKCNAIAWGLAVERLAMLLYDIEDIRKLVGPMCDLDWIRYFEYPKIGFE